MSIKNTFLAGLANFDHEKVKGTLSVELSNIKESLLTATDYEEIKENIDLLEKISHQFPSDAVTILDQLVERLPETELTYSEELQKNTFGFSKKYFNAEGLIVRCLQVYEHLRYLEHEKALYVFLEYACHPNEEVAKAAEQGLKSLAEYNLSVIRGTEQRKGVGYAVQQVVIEDLLKLDPDALKARQKAVLIVCTKLVSPTCKGTDWTYNSCTITMGPVQATEATQKIRSDTLELLQKLFGLSETLDEKTEIIGTMMQATRDDERSKPDSDEVAMVNNDTIRILNFFESIVSDSEFQLLEQLEESAWRIFYHATDEEVRNAALKVKAELEKKDEYQVFKTLIGFRGRFGEWYSRKQDVEADRQGRDRWEEERNAREQAALALVDEIEEGNWADWKSKIVEYASIKSNDLATFPVFGAFLNRLGKEKPDFALDLVEDHPEPILNFRGLAKGLMASEKSDLFVKRFLRWVKQDQYLEEAIRMLTSEDLFDETLFREAFQKTIKREFETELTLMTEVVAERYKTTSIDSLIDNYFIPVIGALSKLKSCHWVDRCWFSDGAKEMMSDLNENQAQAVFDNLLNRQSIDTHTDWLVAPLAKTHPELAIQFFRNRIEIEVGDEPREAFDPDRYQAVPYQIDKLKEALSSPASMLVNEIIGWNDFYSERDWPLARYHIARLVKVIFPIITTDLSDELIELVEKDDHDSVRFVISILGEYEGEPFTHPIVEAILQKHCDTDTQESLFSILDNTGVVAGEYGFVKAFEQKKEEIIHWLEGQNPVLREFAAKYAEYLDQRIESEKLRADENIALRKYEFGDSEQADPDE